MNIWESILVSLEGIVANKMRAALTMLGVIIGVGAVITMLALAQGAREQTMQRIQQMGTNVLTVFSGRSRSSGSRVSGGMGSTQILTMDDVEAIAAQCPSVKATAPEVQTSCQLKYQNQNSNTTVLGTTPAYLGIRNYQIQDGRMFTAEEVRGCRKVAVIGPTTAETLFGTSSPVGQYIRVQGIRFEIIGLMKTKGAQGGFMDPDDQLTIPATTAMRRVIGTQYVRSIDVQATSMQTMDQANSEVDALIRQRHRLSADDQSFMIRSQADIMEMAEETSQMFTMLLAGIASVSLIVGGIGIMNIMLVSVTERTREIGIRMALGARRHDIQLQFLVEALVLSLCGGTIGVLLGLLGSVILAGALGWNTSVSLSSIGLSFSFAAFVGIFFGYYPARQASRLKPIDALRYE
ncbi:MAG TPA: ABC transporter permease [Armatimonadota bacterium]|nr:ABC transporter permease [Armatimonadota bacterium]